MEQVNKTIGSVRLEYIDIATKSMGSGDLPGALQYIENFLLTVKDTHQSSEDIQKSFDESLKKKEKYMEDQKKQADKLLSDQKINSWEHSEMVNSARVDSQIQEINDRLNELWQISLRHGLFKE